MKRLDHLKTEHGFTLAELLVACVIIAFVMAGLLIMLQTGQQSYLVGSNQVGVDASAVTLATGINSLTLTYQDSTGATTGTAANIRTIVVALTAQPQNQPAATQQGRVLVTMTDSVRVRNR